MNLGHVAGRTRKLERGRHTAEIEFFKWLSLNLKTRKTTWLNKTRDLGEVLEDGVDMKTPMFTYEVDRKSNFYEGDHVKVEYTLMPTKKVFSSINQFCKMVKEKFEYIMYPFEFINKWGLLHLSYYLGMDDLTKMLENMKNIDKNLKFSLEEDQPDISFDDDGDVEMVDKPEITEMKKKEKAKKMREAAEKMRREYNREINNRMRIYDDTSMFDNVIAKRSKSKFGGTPVLYDVLTDLDKPKIPKLLKYYNYHNEEGRRVRYYVFQYGRWKDFIEEDKLRGKTKGRYARVFPMESYRNMIYKNEHARFETISFNDRIKIAEDMRHMDPKSKFDYGLPLEEVEFHPWKVYTPWIFGATPKEFSKE